MYIVEGNIGVGKSTFLNTMKKLNPTLEIVPEPKEDWTKPIKGESLLDNFYTDPSRWAYTMETLALMRRSRDYIRQDRSTTHTQLVERSIFSGHYCFAQNSNKTGYFSSHEWNLYNAWVRFLLKQCTPPKGFIYLRAKPEICFERIKKRNRVSETSLDKEYVKNIHEWHDQFLLYKKNLFASLQNVPVLVLDCNSDFLHNEKVLHEHSSALNRFFKDKNL